MTEPSNAGAKADYTFGQVALRENLCTFEQVKECLDIQSKLRGLGIEPKKLGEILIEKGYLTPVTAARVVQLQSQAPARAASPTTSAPSPPSPTGGSSKLNIPGYEVLSKIGQGAMGTVYRARQISMDRIVALKVLASRYSKDRSFVERFIREARAVAKLNHENIISGIDVGEASGLHYFVMEFVDGVPVTAILKKEGRLDERRCLQIAQQIARALVHAHRHSIVHRDIKPENVMITGAGVAKLCDLGLAKNIKSDTGVTLDGTSVGTPNYISPEQARGEDDIDIRTDLYSLGASLYHMSTGSPPFSGANPMVVMTKHVTEYADPPRKRHPALSESFSALVMKMIQKRREDRYQDPESLLADLEKLLGGGEIAPASAPSPARATVTPRSSTHAPSRPRPSTVVKGGLLRKPAVPVVPIAVGAGVLVAALVAYNFMAGGTAAPPPPPSRAGGGSATTLSPPPPDVTARIRTEIDAFHKLHDPELGNVSNPNRFTEPYGTIQKRVDHYKSLADFVAQKAWQDELASFSQKVNQLIQDNVWTPIRRRAQEHFDAGRYAKAQEEIARFEEVYRWFRRDDRPEKTAAGRDHDEFSGKIASTIKDAFVTSMVQAEQARKDPKRKDEAYALLDAAAEAGTAQDRADVEDRRARYLREDVDGARGGAAGDDGFRKSLEKIDALKALHAGNPAALRTLSELAEKSKSTIAEAVTSAMSQALSLYLTSYRPAFDAAIRRRDLPAARKALSDLYFASAASQSAFLPAPGTDVAAIRTFLDPQRTAAPEVRKIVTLAEEGVKFAALQGARYETARETYVDLRIAVLTEDLLEQAGEGGRAVSRDPARFKQGYSVALQAAVSVEPGPRKAGESPSLAVSVGTSKAVIPLVPAGKLPEEDIVALARRSPAAASDPLFGLKAFYLFLFADKLPPAKDWLDRLSPEHRVGTERYLDRFKGMSSSREEEEVRKLFTDAWQLLHTKKDTVGATKKFKECLERYGGTEFMRAKVTPGGRTRIEIVEDNVGGADGKPKGMRPGLKDALAATEFRDLGRGRIEATYTFADDRPALMFSTADGTVQAQRQGGAMRLEGNGQWLWNAPLKGNVSIEIVFSPRGDGGIGLVVHGTGGQSGYLAVGDLAVPGFPPMDAILRLPVKIETLLTAVLVQGGTGLQQERRAANTASLSKEGTRLKFTLNKGVLEADSPAFNEGRIGIGLANHRVDVERVKISGEVDPAWLDALLKK